MDKLTTVWYIFYPVMLPKAQEYLENSEAAAFESYGENYYRGNEDFTS